MKENAFTERFVSLTKNKELRTKNKENILVLREDRAYRQAETERIADYLVEKFRAPEHRPLFLKVAWRLSKGKIDRLVGLSFDSHVTSPKGYFIKLVKQEPSYGRE